MNDGTEQKFSNDSLKRVKSLKNHLSSNVALKDIHDLEQDIDALLYEKKNLINYFEEINWQDPFPSKSTSSKGDIAPVVPAGSKTQTKHAGRKRRTSLIDATNIDMLVYDESKFTEACPPTMIFLPNKMILRKMMKVCS